MTRQDADFIRWRRQMTGVQLTEFEKRVLAIEAKDPEETQTYLELFGQLRGIEPPGPVHPVSGEPLSYPMSKDDAAALNHAYLRKVDPGRWASMNCDCSFCVAQGAEEK